MFVITKESELHHSIGSLIDGAHPGPKTDRDYLFLEFVLWGRGRRSLTFWFLLHVSNC